ncbi:MAG: hypothetical protein L3J33_10225 [Rhodobacteraceae bacterium]|nr:hypothetical protein [Paracoccaceae bacterium]
MPYGDIKTRIRLFLEMATHQPEDLHELQESLRKELSVLKAQGLPQPDDLVELEAQLEKDLNIPGR